MGYRDFTLDSSSPGQVSKGHQDNSSTINDDPIPAIVREMEEQEGVAYFRKKLFKAIEFPKEFKK
jgi:hypothetical protein